MDKFNVYESTQDIISSARNLLSPPKMILRNMKSNNSTPFKTPASHSRAGTMKMHGSIDNSFSNPNTSEHNRTIDTR